MHERGADGEDAASFPSSTAPRSRRYDREVQRLAPPLPPWPDQPCRVSRTGLAKYSRFWRPVSLQYTLRSPLMDTPIRLLTSLAFFTTSRPATLHEPPSGSSRVHRTFTVDVFPAPFGPSRLKNSPSPMSRLRSSMATRSVVSGRPTSLRQTLVLPTFCVKTFLRSRTSINSHALCLDLF